jgi:hypothetical protein
MTRSQRRVNEQIDRSPEPTAKRKIRLVLCGLAVTVAAIASLAILAGVLRHILSLL